MFNCSTGSWRTYLPFLHQVFSNVPPSNLQNSSKIFNLSSILHFASILTLFFVLFVLQDTWTWDLLSCNFIFFSLFLHSDSKSLIALPESYLQESSPSRALRLLFSKKALLFPVISEANSRLGAKHASLLLRLSLSKHTERIWNVRSSDAEVRHFSYGTALKTL